MTAIFGASGHAREIAFILKHNNQAVDYFVANDSDSKSINSVPVITETAFFKIAKQTTDEIKSFIAVGNGNIRKKIYQKITSELTHISFPNLFYNITESSLKENRITLGEGNIFFPGVTLMIDVAIGNHNHFNTHCSVSHDCKIGDFNTVSPGVNIAGKVVLGDLNNIGMNAAIIHNTTLNNNIIIGAGATVVKDIEEPGTYVGIPAKKIK